MSGSSDYREKHIQDVLESCMRRRIAGEPLPDDEIIRGHGTLMPELGRELQKLAFIERAESLASDAGDPGSAAAPAIPGYTILREIHRGGQGIVYLATQRGMNRPVAIKVLRAGPFAGPRDRARFAREIEVLGQLKHPNIVAIHDSGSVMGSFYYVMDFIDGLALDQWVAQVGSEKPAAQRSRSEIREVLAVFAKICDAVNAAHLSGVIHRDLKPSNIRVDAEGEPHVLDFGLAKRLAADPEQSVVTASGQFVGSLSWASPEQAAGKAVDIRTDVYALGLVLYHLLTRRFPYNVEGNLHDVLARINTAAPIRPSTLAPRVDDETETILLKCLQKDPERRYQSAGELRRDIQRYLAGEPIEAKRDSGWYLLKKSVQRHRLRAATITAFLLLLITSLAVMAVLFRGAMRNEQLANDERNRAVEARSRSAADAETARRATEFLVDLFRVSDPSETSGAEITVREMLEAGAERIVADLDGQPVVQAALMDAIGRAYQNLGLFDPALPFLERALRIRRELPLKDVLAVAASMNNLAALHNARGDYAQAEPLLRAALNARRQELGAQHPMVAATMAILADSAMGLGRHDEAERIHREAVDIGHALAAGDPELAGLINNLAQCLWYRNRYAEAEPLFQDVLNIRRSVFGTDHRDVAQTLASLGLIAYRQGRHEQAEEWFRQALEIREKLYGEDHPAVIRGINQMALVLWPLGREEESLELQREAIQRASRTLGADHPSVAVYQLNLALKELSGGQYDDAESTYRSAIDILRRRQPEHPRLANALYRLGLTRLRQGAPVDAEHILRECLDLGRRVEFPSGAWLRFCHRSVLGEAVLSQGRFEEAETILLEALRSLEAYDATERDPIIRNNWRTAVQETRARVVHLYQAWNKPDEAAKWRAEPAPDDDARHAPDSRASAPTGVGP